MGENNVQGVIRLVTIYFLYVLLCILIVIAIL